MTDITEVALYLTTGLSVNMLAQSLPSEHFVFYMKEKKGMSH